tara:strand:+ start:1941 stop:2144 length:204 start_codon:yes stop_codon:yes gene_type:complete
MSIRNRFFKGKKTGDFFPERNQAEDLKQQIRICQKMKTEAAIEGNIYKWRKFEDREQKARTILYNIK